MGKYPDSELLSKYSNWHLAKCGTQSYMTDSDVNLVGMPFIYRLWIEVRDIANKLMPVAVIDVKSHLDDSIPTRTSQVWYGWLEANKMPVYIVQIFGEFETFRVQRWYSKELRTMDEAQYIRFIKALTLI